MERLPFESVVQMDVETARHGHHQLVQPLVGMPRPVRPAGHVVEVIDPPDLERDVLPALDESQVAARFAHDRQVDHADVLQWVIRRHHWVRGF